MGNLYYMENFGTFSLNDFIEVESSRIHSYLYRKEVLLLRFHRPFYLIYTYTGITRDIFDGFINSESKGKFLEIIIRTSKETFKTRIE